MWLLLARRFRLWWVFAVGAPVLSWVLGVVGDRLERRNGPTGASRALKAGREWLGRRARGPLARNDETPR